MFSEPVKPSWIAKVFMSISLIPLNARRFFSVMAWKPAYSFVTQSGTWSHLMNANPLTSGSRTMVSDWN